MKKTLQIITTLAFIAGTSALAQTADTNSPNVSTNQIVKPYPLNYCLVSGDKLNGDMGKPVVQVYQGQEFKFCCHDCVKDFNKDPDKYVKKLQAAEKQPATDSK